MSRRGLVTAVLAGATLAGAAGQASAGKHAMLVLKADGNADARVKAKVDAAVVKLAAQSPDGNVTPGDISYADAAAAAGCKPEVAACANEVIATFATDEIVITNITRRGSMLEISVRRATKNARPREITATIPADAPEMQLDAVNTLFGLAAPRPVAPPVAPVRPATPVAPVVDSNASVNPFDTTPPATTAPTTPPAISTTTTTTPPVEMHPPAQPAQPGGAFSPGSPSQQVGPPPARVDDDYSDPHKAFYVGGWIGGGALMLAGMGLWSSAGDIQDQIDAAPKKTASDFTKLKELESRGDSKASAGNVVFVIGLGAAAVGTYFFIKDRRARSRASAHAMLVPTAFDHGAGLAFTYGPAL